MIESAGKKAARRLFYRECLTDWLDPVQLQTGNFLTLLGEPPKDALPPELPLLAEHAVPRSNVWSVERVWNVYDRQLAMNQTFNAGERVSLWYGEVMAFLGHMLHTDQAFTVLNLDIEGTYMRHLDPMMHSVLLFCWRNPETVVATYSNIGRRDLYTIFEGVKSLGLFLWLQPELTRLFVSIYCNRYASAGFGEPVRMVLRDLFWLRSHLENAAVASAMLGVTTQRRVQRLMEAQDSIWRAIVEYPRRKPTMQLVEDAVARVVSKSRFKRPTKPHLLPRIGISIDQLKHVVYRARHPWSNACYFTRCATTAEPVDCWAWAQQALGIFIDRPLIYIDRHGTRVDIDGGTLPEKQFKHSQLGKLLLWGRYDVYRYKPRSIVVRPTFRHLVGIGETVRRLTSELRREAQDARVTQEIGSSESVFGSGNGALRPTTGESQVAQSTDTHEVGAMASKGNGEQKTRAFRWTNKGKLTNAGRARIRELIDEGLNADEILALPGVPTTVPRRSISAMIAIQNRAGGGRVWVRAGRLTEFGKEEVRRLLGEGYTPGRMIQDALVGGNVTPSMIRYQKDLMRIEAASATE